MKRELFDNVSVVIGAGKAVDREGYISAVFWHLLELSPDHRLRQNYR